MSVTKPNDTIDGLSSWVACRKMELAADYVNRGRRHASLSDGDLLAAWEAALHDFCSDWINPDKRLAECDFSMEATLRGLPLPMDAVTNSLSIMHQSFAHAVESLRAIDPERLERCELQITRTIDDFLTGAPVHAN